MEGDVEGGGEAWSEADARAIAGHYLTNLLVERPYRRPSREGTRALVAAPRVRGAKRQLQVWAYALPATQPGRGAAGGRAPTLLARLKRLWALFKALFGGSEPRLAPASPARPGR